jgi:hypothetical protein
MFLQAKGILMKSLIFFLIFLVLFGCVEEGYYTCTYEERHTGCGGKGWTDWKSECINIDMDDYKEGWTPQKVCGKYSGSDTNCGGSCCIYIQYQNNRVSPGECS